MLEKKSLLHKTQLKDSAFSLTLLVLYNGLRPATDAGVIRLSLPEDIL